MSARSDDDPNDGDFAAALRADAARCWEGSTADVERLYRNIAEAAFPADLRVAWLGNHTLAPVQRHATVAAFAHGVILDNHVGDHDQYFQAVLDERSALHAFSPDVVVLWLALRTLAPSLVCGGAASRGSRAAEAESVLDLVDRWVEAARARTPAGLFLCNFPRPPAAPLGLADLKVSGGDAEIYSALNQRLCERYRGDPRVHVLDIDAAIACAGRQVSRQPRMQHLAKIEWSGPGQKQAAELIARALRASVRPTSKCVVLDLDDTLWGGILGEDGPDGIKIGPGDPAGEAHAEFQRTLLDIKARGVLLAVASKNNREDVDEAFARVAMPLGPSDFAAMEIHWQPKPASVAAIAERLNIGLDSIVFIDDSPAECELIRRSLPEVEVVALPKDPADYAGALQRLWSFDKLQLTDEDHRKTEQYRADARRVELKTSFGDLAEYLKSLETRVTLRPATQAALPRLHQLFSKTNQFNVTTKRYGAAEIARFIDSNDCIFETAAVEDAFGDLGLVGLYLVKLDGSTARIDSFVLSCRAMGRDVETAMCNRLKQRAFGTGADVLVAEYVPTRRNRPAARFFEAQRFRILAADEQGTVRYAMTAAEAAPLPCPTLEVRIAGAPSERDPARGAALGCPA